MNEEGSFDCGFHETEAAGMEQVGTAREIEVSDGKGFDEALAEEENVAAILFTAVAISEMCIA